jgi:hypothetical protein
MMNDQPTGFSKAAHQNRKEFFTRLRRVTSMHHVTAGDLLDNVLSVNMGDRSDKALYEQIK